MARNILTEYQVQNAREPDGEKLLADGEGLYLRLRPGGAKDWLFVYSLDGNRRKQGLGPYPDVTLARARAKAEESRKAVADGRDAIRERDAERARKRAQLTVRELFEEWFAAEASKRKDEGAEVRRTMEKDFLVGSIADLPAAELARRDLMRILDKVKARGAKRITNLILQYVRQMYRWAVEREIATTDPTFGLRKKKLGGQEVERTRVLSHDEIILLAEKLPAAGLAPETEAAIWLMLATLARVGELSRARWSDIDEEAATWMIPAEHAKNGRKHLIHLSPFALALFQSLKGEKRTRYVYPSRDEKGHLDVKVLQRQFSDRQAAVQQANRSKKKGKLLLPDGRWTAHDLRRTGATLMGEMGIRPDVIDRCLNHVESRKVTRTYQRQELHAEREDAFHRLGRLLERLQSGKPDNVVPIRGGQRTTK